MIYSSITLKFLPLDHWTQVRSLRWTHPKCSACESSACQSRPNRPVAWGWKVKIFKCSSKKTVLESLKIGGKNSLNMYVSMYIYTYIYKLYICVYIYMCIYTNRYIYIYTYIYIYVYVYIYMCMCVRVYVYLYLHVCMYVYMYVCMYVSMDGWMYVYILDGHYR